MRVEQLIGRYAGQVIDMKYADAQRLLERGTVRLPGPQSIDTTPAVAAETEPSRRGRGKKAAAERTAKAI